MSQTRHPYVPGSIADDEHPLDGTYVVRMFRSSVVTGTAASCNGEALSVSDP